jgi:hypothetical protein
MAITRSIKPPSGLRDPVSRREAAGLLGFASEFKVRELEKRGHLRPVRGVMGSAWYPRSEVLALRTAMAAPRADRDGDRRSPAYGRWSDGALIAYLRERSRTVVDLVADAGIPISRAERVYRFWLTHDQHPVAAQTRTARREKTERRSPDRLTHDALLQQLRDPDPKVRAAAFEQMKKRR